MQSIDKDRWYTAPEIVDLKAVPILDTIFKVKRFIKAGILKGNTLGTGNGSRYFVKGESLITFLAKWEAGDTNWK